MSKRPRATRGITHRKAKKETECEARRVRERKR